MARAFRGEGARKSGISGSTMDSLKNPWNLPRDVQFECLCVLSRCHPRIYDKILYQVHLSILANSVVVPNPRYSDEIIEEITEGQEDTDSINLTSNLVNDAITIKSTELTETTITVSPITSQINQVETKFIQAFPVNNLCIEPCPVQANLPNNIPQNVFSTTKECAVQTDLQNVPQDTLAISYIPTTPSFTVKTDATTVRPSISTSSHPIQKRKKGKYCKWCHRWGHPTSKCPYTGQELVPCRLRSICSECHPRTVRICPKFRNWPDKTP